MQTNILFLFRAFFPSWKLFEDASEVPVLFYRYTSQNSSQFTSWMPMIEPFKRSWWHLFLNPELNLHHAFRSSLNHLMGDLSENIKFDPNKVEGLASYQVIKQFVFWKLKNKVWTSFQFKIVAHDVLQNLDSDDVLISTVYTDGDF